MNRKNAPYFFLLPFVLSFGVFGLYPLVRSIYVSMHSTVGPTAWVYTGLDNYLLLIRDPDFHTAVWNTLVFTFFSLFLQLPIALGLAMLLVRPGLVGRNTLRFCLFSPYLMGLVYSAMLFARMFAPDDGAINVLLHNLFGMDVERNWLGSKPLVMPALVITALWIYAGFNMIYFLAALQAVDRSLYEAADVDGAGPLSKFFHVTLPGIRHVLVFVVVLSTIGSFQLYELAYLLLNNSSGPDQAGLTIVMYLYETGFVTGDLGYASAVGWVLVLMVMVVAAAQLHISGTLKGTD